MNGRIDTERILDAFLAPEADRLPDRVIDAALADIARTPQRRARRVPWRFPNMSNLSSTARTFLVGALPLVAVVGGTYLVSGTRPPAMSTGAPPTTAAPTGISGWQTYTSEIHGLTVGYPADWAVNAPATRKWQQGDKIHRDEWPYADTFISPEQEAVGLFVWEMPAGEGADVESVQGLKAWAETFCADVGALCEEDTHRAAPMCLNRGGVFCRAAILVPTAREQYAFFVDWGSAMLTDMPDLVTVVIIGREDNHPSAARYGGSVELLKSVLTTMDVWTPKPGQLPG